MASVNLLPVAYIDPAYVSEGLSRLSATQNGRSCATPPPNSWPHDRTGGSSPFEMTGIGIASRYRSATREASADGDLYEIIPTGRGIRVIIGDVWNMAHLRAAAPVVTPAEVPLS